MYKRLCVFGYKNDLLPGYELNYRNMNLKSEQVEDCFSMTTVLVCQ